MNHSFFLNSDSDSDSESINPDSDELIMNGRYGLDNLGNTCYLNSIIQTLVNLPSLQKFILSKDFLPFQLIQFNNSNELLNDQLSSLLDSCIYQLYRIIKTIMDGSIECSSIKPSTLRSKLALHNNIFKISRQQDAQEAFGLIIEIMHNEISQKININYNPENLVEKACNDFWASPNNYSPLYNLLHGMYCTTNICSSCNYTMTNFQPNLFLGLDIPFKSIKNNISFILDDLIEIRCKIPNIIISSLDKKEMCKAINAKTTELIQEKHYIFASKYAKFNIQDCLNDYIQPSTIQDVLCSNCNTKCDSQCHHNLVIAPKILAIHFKRFDNDCMKKDNHISFPLELSIESIISQDHRVQQNYNYKLYSVINHSSTSGELNYGHYYTFTYSTIHEKWFKFNDSKVSEIEETDIDTPNAYLLFYERLD